ARYKGVDLTTFGRVMNWQGIELASRADGWQTMTWPSGRFDDMVGDGEIRAATVDGRAVAAPQLVAFVSDPARDKPFDRPIDAVPVSGRVTYRLTPTAISIQDGWAATPETHLSFHGTTGWNDNANIPFRVVSTAWQESDRLLAAVLTAFGSRTSPIEIGGRGVFEGAMTRWFSRPLITGHFVGERMRAWNVLWGAGAADVTVENSYVSVANSSIGDGQRKIVADGKYSLGFPRADGGEEIDARITVDRWPLTDFKTFFELQDWPIEGTVFSDVQIYGRYRGPQGFGLLRVEPGTAWEETFDSFTGRLSFEGEGVRIDGAEVSKSTGFVRGAGYVGWPPTPEGWGTYSFTFDGEKIPVESLVSFTVPDANLTGVLNFTMRGSGSTEHPRYEWDGRVADLFWGDEGIGQATAHMIIEEKMMTIDRLDVASDRLSVSGSGQVQRNDTYDGSFSLRFNETSVDPFLRFVAPQLSPYTQAVVSGAVRMDGQLANLSKLDVDLTIDRADLKLFDYELTNPVNPAGERVPLRMAFKNDVLTICGVAAVSTTEACSGSAGAFTLSGEGTSLTLGGRINRASSTMDVSVDGTASLAVIQGVVQDVRSSGDATIQARVSGSFDAPVYAGNATITNGRLRHFSFPHSLDSIHGVVHFDASGIRLDGLRARMGTGARTGGGEITFGGSIGLDAFTLSTLNVTARGDGLDLRFPEGFRSIVDADLSLTGTMDAALVGGRITVRQARYTRRLQSNAGLLGFAGLGGGSAAGVVNTGPLPDLPIRFELELVGQRLTVIDDSDATVIVSPDLKLTGSLATPALAGRVDIDRGETEFLGNRYTVDGFVEFTNPDRIEPYFDIEARTQIRQPEQDYRLDLTITGTLASFTYSLNSDPPLSQSDKIALILGQNPNLDRAELRTLESTQDVQSQLMQSVVAQLLTSPISTQVGRVVERTGLVDTFTLTPLLAPDATLQQLNPGARVTVGQRISRRVYLTYSRSLDNSSLDYDILLLEYAQNDQRSWVLSRNQDGTFALDFRVRYRF
ncbi:MAG: translocation/assembly module TamB domain-containing protein, partial [Vicinamibacterales bacterium]